MPSDGHNQPAENFLKKFAKTVDKTGSLCYTLTIEGRRSQWDTKPKARGQARSEPHGQEQALEPLREGSQEWHLSPAHLSGHIYLIQPAGRNCYRSVTISLEIRN